MVISNLINVYRIVESSTNIAPLIHNKENILPSSYLNPQKRDVALKQQIIAVVFTETEPAE
ncbi:CLUMA_CG000498, isoform A [Clunio marinus]|uniref:CLUMA_CG000498, isoform A n=1 Tax=Clunio marinus TaxID=568069 RepID=A0A1J1HJL4_9DIPT|nr:CLUMA_CG000498, isoform A [Clunio marinus]